MKKVIYGFEIDVPPECNPFGSDYAWHIVKKETDKAYLMQYSVLHRTFGAKLETKWVAKSVCKVDKNGDVFAPVWLLPKNDLLCG